MENCNNDVIDLTSMDYYIPCNNNLAVNDSVVFCGEFIDLENESFVAEENKRREREKKSKEQNAAKKTAEEPKEGNSTQSIGNCSICWDKLGINPLASTKCGHVYCLACLERSLKNGKVCPTCRRSLKGPSAYHPLYLELG